MGTCGACDAAVDREGGVLFCSILEESVGLEDGCETDFRPKGATCGTCGCRVAKAESETGWSCHETGYDVAQSQKACPAWEPIVENDVDEAKSLSGKAIEEEVWEINDTVDFNLYRLPGFAQAMSFARAKIYAYLSDNPSETPEINIKLKFPEGVCKPDIKVSLPNNIKISLQATTVIRENGTIRLEVTEQTDLFNHEDDDA